MGAITYAQARATLALEDAWKQLFLSLISGQNPDGTAFLLPTGKVGTPPSYSTELASLGAQNAEFGLLCSLISGQNPDGSPYSLPLAATSSVKNFGAAGDGVTDDTAALQNAVNAASSAGGGVVFFPPGTYIVSSTLTLKSSVILQGSGPSVTRIKRKAGVNIDVVTTQGYQSTEAFGFGLWDIMIDGNHGLNGADPVGGAGGSGLLAYGAGWTGRNVVIANCKNFGLRSNGSGSYASNPPFLPSDYVVFLSQFVVADCYGTAIMEWAGPTDCHFDQFWVFHRDYTNPPANRGLNLTSSGHKLTNGHIWGEALLIGLYAVGGNDQFGEMVVESSSGNPGGAPLAGQANVVLEGSAKVFQGVIYDNTAAHGSKVGIRLGTVAGTSLQESIIDVQVSECWGGGIVGANVGPSVQVRGQVAASNAGAQPFTGTFGSTFMVSYDLPGFNGGRFQTLGDTEIDLQGGTFLVKQAASPTVPTQQWQDSNGNLQVQVSKNGYFMTRKQSAPADADLVAGEMALWFDSTNGAAKLMVKAKEAGGTVRTGSLALT